MYDGGAREDGYGSGQTQEDNFFDHPAADPHRPHNAWMGAKRTRAGGRDFRNGTEKYRKRATADPRPSTVAALRQALEAGGAEFLGETIRADRE